jgi:hypothetical protein
MYLRGLWNPPATKREYNKGWKSQTGLVVRMKSIVREES